MYSNHIWFYTFGFTPNRSNDFHDPICWRFSTLHLSTIASRLTRVSFKYVIFYYISGLFRRFCCSSFLKYIELILLYRSYGRQNRTAMKVHIEYPKYIMQILFKAFSSKVNATAWSYNYKCLTNCFLGFYMLLKCAYLCIWQNLVFSQYFKETPWTAAFSVRCQFASHSQISNLSMVSEDHPRAEQSATLFPISSECSPNESSWALFVFRIQTFLERCVSPSSKSVLMKKMLSQSCFLQRSFGSWQIVTP